MNAVDIVARGLAMRASNHQNEPNASAMPAVHFDDLAQVDIGDNEVVVTKGKSVDGLGEGIYIADDLATQDLLDTHPRAVSQTMSGRIVRLSAMDGAVCVEQFGAAGDGITNDQPAIHAALDYAAAMGIGTVLFRSKSYAIHGVARTSPGSAKFARDGHPLVVTSNIELRSAIGDSELLFKGLGGASGETTWQVIKHKDTDPQPNFVWRGGGLMVLGDHGP